MAANNSLLTVLKNDRRIRFVVVIAAAGVCLTIFIILVSKPGQKPQNPPSTANTTQKPLTAGGMPVPTAWQDKARRLGYYCPSWNAKPGEASSSICFPLDK